MTLVWSQGRSYIGEPIVLTTLTSILPLVTQQTPEFLGAALLWKSSKRVIF